MTEVGTPSHLKVYKDQGRLKALFVTLHDASRLQRVSRFIGLLRSLGFDVHLLGPPIERELSITSHTKLSALSSSGSAFLHHAKKIRYLLGSLLPGYRALHRSIERRFDLAKIMSHIDISTYDLVVVEEVELLPPILARRTSELPRVVCELRDVNLRGEYWDFTSAYHIWREKRIYRRALAEADAIITVSEGQRKALHEYSSLDSHVLRSLPPAANLAPSPVSANSIRLVYHGLVSRYRRSMFMIELMQHLDDRFTLDVFAVAVPGDKTLSQLRKEAALHDRVTVHDPVPPENLISRLQSFDLSLIVFPSRATNHRTALPNKFFESIQACLGVIAAEDSDMTPYLRDWGLGVTVPRFSVRSVAAKLNSLHRSDIVHFKERAHLASEVLKFESEEARYRSLLAELLEGLSATNGHPSRESS